MSNFTREKDAEVVSKIMREQVQNAVSLKVPLICNVGVGKTWHEAKENMLN